MIFGWKPAFVLDHIVLWKKLNDFIFEYGNISWLINGFLHMGDKLLYNTSMY